ncbi:MAG TPA: hypothetical protein VLL77_06560, partial [Anaerolineales bacterium]|nr:hypothetical protein [Anaerolineales bacterium]
GWTPVGPLDGDSLAQYPQGAIAALGSALLRPLQAALLNFATPSPELNSRIADGLAMLQEILGVSIEGAALSWDWNHEDLAGSPVHLLVILAAILCVTVKRGWPKVGVTYTICLVTGYVLLPITVSYAVIPTSIRYQLTFLVGGSPLVGLALGRYLKPKALLVLAFFFMLAATPWVLFNKTRPVVAMRPDPGPGELPCLAGCTAVGSVFTSPKTDLLFANLRPRLEGYVGTTRSLREKSCRDVGLRIDSHDPEYALWYLLGAPQSGFHLETVYAVVDPNPLRDRDFKPCAIICTICGDRTRLHGLELYSAWQGTALFLGDGFTWYEDG